MPTISSSTITEGPLVVDVLALEGGEMFVVIRPVPEMSLILDGVDHACAAKARELASALLTAARRIESSRPAPVATAAPAEVDEEILL